MFTVTWRLADGRSGEDVLRGDQRWTFGRAGADPVTVSFDHPALSRQALTIRDAGRGPVVFRGQRENGARIDLVGLAGDRSAIAGSTAAVIEAHANRVELALGDRTLLVLDVTYGPRPRITERLAGEAAPS